MSDNGNFTPGCRNKVGNSDQYQPALQRAAAVSSVVLPGMYEDVDDKDLSQLAKEILHLEHTLKDKSRDMLVSRIACSSSPRSVP